MKPYHLKKLFRNARPWVFMILPGLYFVVMSILLYRVFGIESILFYIAEGVLIASMFWGFLDGFRSTVAIALFAVIFVHFMIGNVYTSAIFLISPFLLFNMRDYGFIGVGLLILLIPYVLVNHDKMSTKTPRTEMVKLYSSILFNAPKYELSIPRGAVLLMMIREPRELDLRLNHHVVIEKNDGLLSVRLVDGYENPSHPEYAFYKKKADRINDSFEKDHQEKEKAKKESLHKSPIEENNGCSAGKFIVSTSSLNVREFPEKGSSKMGVLNKGDSICGSIEKRRWVYSDIHRGWVYLEYLKAE